MLVAYSVEVEGAEAVARLAAEASTGVGHDVCALWPPLAESLGAVVYHWEPERKELRVAFSVALFDRSVLDGRVRPPTL